MATMYVSEFNFLGGTGNRPVQGVQTPPIAEQIVTIGGASTAITNAFNANTTVIRVAVDTTCSIAFGATPVATTANMRLAGNQTEYFTVIPGQKVAVIANS